MAETVLIKLVPPTFPAGFCPPNYQAEWEAGVALMRAELSVSGVTPFYNFGNTVPTPQNRLFPWIRTNSDGSPDDTYVYALGFWLSLYKFAPAAMNGLRIWYEGSEESVLTLDGGENATVSLTTGPFWAIDHNYDGRIPMGAGVITGALPAKTLGVGENYGEASHIQAAAEVGPHVHPITSKASFSHDGVVDVVESSSSTDDGLAIGLTGSLTTPLSVGANSYAAGQLGMPILPPIRGMYALMRTMRRFRRI